MKSTHGGARKGAGRPPEHGEKMARVFCNLPQAMVAELEREAVALGVSRSELMRRRLRPIIPRAT